MLSLPSSEIELIVKGTKLDVNRQTHREPPQRRKRYPLKHIHVERSSVEEDDDKDDKEEEETEEEDERKEYRIPRRPIKEIFRLNTATFAVKDVQNDHLRVIRESHKVQDLRRLLNSHLGAKHPDRQPHANRRNGHHLTAIGVDPDAIYRHFFQDHYDAIRHAVEEDEENRHRVHHDYQDSDVT